MSERECERETERGRENFKAGVRGTWTLMPVQVKSFLEQWRQEMCVPLNEKLCCVSRTAGHELPCCFPPSSDKRTFSCLSRKNAAHNVFDFGGTCDARPTVRFGCRIVEQMQRVTPLSSGSDVSHSVLPKCNPNDRQWQLLHRGAQTPERRRYAPSSRHVLPRPASQSQSSSESSVRYT